MDCQAELDVTRFQLGMREPFQNYFEFGKWEKKLPCENDSTCKKTVSGSVVIIIRYNCLLRTQLTLIVS